MGNCTVMKSVSRDSILNGHDIDYNPLTLQVTEEVFKTDYALYERASSNTIPGTFLCQHEKLFGILLTTTVSGM